MNARGQKGKQEILFPVFSSLSSVWVEELFPLWGCPGLPLSSHNCAFQESRRVAEQQTFLVLFCTKAATLASGRERAGRRATKALKRPRKPAGVRKWELRAQKCNHLLGISEKGRLCPETLFKTRRRQKGCVCVCQSTYYLLRLLLKTPRWLPGSLRASGTRPEPPPVTIRTRSCCGRFLRRSQLFHPTTLAPLKGRVWVRTGCDAESPHHLRM